LAATNGTQNSFNVNGRGLGMSASDHAWDTVFGTAERVWYFTLNWISAHTLPSLAIALLIALWIVSGRQTKLSMARMKLEFEAERSSARSNAGVKSPTGKQTK